VIAYLLNSG